MKTTILLFCFVLLSASLLHAQIDKGRIQIGGSINASHQKYDGNQFGNGYKNTSVGVSPSIGKFYETNKLAGLFLNFSYAENTGPNPYITRGFGGGVFFRQYKPVASKLYVLFDERAGFTYFTGEKNVVFPNGYAINASFQTGMAYDIFKKVQLELLLNNLLYAQYSHSDNTETYAIGTSFESNLLNNVAFGFRFYLE